MNAITERPDLAHWPLSPEQRAVLTALDTQEGDASAMASPQVHIMAIDIEGALDVSRLERTLSDLRLQHEALSTALCKVAGYRGLRHQALDALADIEWLHEDLRGRDDKETRLDEHAEALRQHPLAVEHGELLRPALLRTGDTAWALLLAVSALAADRGGLQALFSALPDAYALGGAADDEPALQYSQFIEWRASLESDEDAQQGREYWQAHQQGAEQAGRGVCLPGAWASLHRAQRMSTWPGHSNPTWSRASMAWPTSFRYPQRLCCRRFGGRYSPGSAAASARWAVGSTTAGRITR